MNSILIIALMFLTTQGRQNTEVISFDEIPYSSQFQLSPSGEVVIENDNQLYVGGEAVSLGVGDIISNFAPLADCLVVNTLKREEDGSWKKFMCVVDYGTLKTKRIVPHPDSTFYRGISEVNGKIFLNQLVHNAAYGNETRQFQEVRLDANLESSELGFSGYPFHRRIFEANSLQSLAGESFLVQPHGSDRLFAMHAISKKMTIMEQTRGQWVVAAYKDLELEDYIQPFFHKKLENGSPKWDKDERLQYFYSFSRIVNFEPYRKGFLVGYQIPDPSHKWYSKDETASARYPFILCLQTFDEAGSPSGPVVKMQGAYLLGIQGDRLVTAHLTGERGGYNLQIHKTSLNSGP